MKKISVCYVLSYYSPKYVRTEVLVQALERIHEVELYQARNSSKGLLRYLQTLLKLIVIRVLYNPQYYILGFRGYEFFWMVRIITLGKKLIYDHMMSPYDSLRNEKSAVRKNGAIDKAVYFYEKSVLLASDLILTDTEIHKQYFSKLFNLSPERIEAVPIGTDENLFHVCDPLPRQGIAGLFEVLYYGSFLPLHGMDIILKAAFLLRKKPIHFTLIGGNRLDLSGFHKMVSSFELSNVTHIDWVEFEELPAYIAQSDLGLGGPFGGTGQAGRVITGKTFQFLAMAKPIIIGKHQGSWDGFVDKQNCLYVPQGDANSLADVISWAFEHPRKLSRIGRCGYELFKNDYSIEKISEKLREIIKL